MQSAKARKRQSTLLNSVSAILLPNVLFQNQWLTAGGGREIPNSIRL